VLAGEVGAERQPADGQAAVELGAHAVDEGALAGAAVADDEQGAAVLAGPGLSREPGLEDLAAGGLEAGAGPVEVGHAERDLTEQAAVDRGQALLRRGVAGDREVPVADARLVAAEDAAQVGGELADDRRGGVVGVAEAAAHGVGAGLPPRRGLAGLEDGEALDDLLGAMGAQRGEGVVHRGRGRLEEPSLDAIDGVGQPVGELLDQAHAVAEAGARRLVALLGGAGVLDDEEVVVEHGLDALELGGGVVDGGGDAGVELAEEGLQAGLEGLGEPAAERDLDAGGGARGLDARVLGGGVEADVLRLAGEGRDEVVAQGGQSGAVGEAGRGGAEGAAGAVEGGPDVLLEGGLPRARLGAGPLGLGGLGLSGGGRSRWPRGPGLGRLGGVLEGLGDEAELGDAGGLELVDEDVADAVLERGEPRGQADDLWVEDHGRSISGGGMGRGAGSRGARGPGRRGPCSAMLVGASSRIRQPARLSRRVGRD
jgi:hypothetical protein